MRVSMRGFYLRCLVGSFAVWLSSASARAEGDRSYKKDAESHRSAGVPNKVGLFLIGDVGYRMLRMNKVDFGSDKDVIPKLIPSTSHGIAPSVALGVRLWFLSLAARGEVAFFNGSKRAAYDSQFQMFNLDLELAFRAPLGRLEPYVLLGGGYSGVGSLSAQVDGQKRHASTHGGNIRTGLGLDVFVGRFGMFGVRATLDGVFMSSKVRMATLVKPQQVDTVGDAKARLRQADGVLAGFSPAITLTAGLRL